MLLADSGAPTATRLGSLWVRSIPYTLYARRGKRFLEKVRSWSMLLSSFEIDKSGLSWTAATSFLTADADETEEVLATKP